MTHPHVEPAAQSLEGIAVFKDVSADGRVRIERRCRWRVYEPGDFVIDHLDISDNVYFISVGEVRVSLYSPDGKAVAYCDLGQGDMFGEYAAIDGAPRCASVEARTSCLVASLNALAFGEVLQSEPTVALALLRQFVGRIRELTARVFEFSSFAVKHRVEAELLRLSTLAPREGKSAWIDPAPTHEDIASYISTHREAVSREFARLARMGIIERHGRALHIKDVERLRAIVHEVTGEWVGS